MLVPRMYKASSIQAFLVVFESQNIINNPQINPTHLNGAPTFLISVQNIFIKTAVITMSLHSNSD